MTVWVSEPLAADLSLRGTAPGDPNRLQVVAAGRYRLARIRPSAVHSGHAMVDGSVPYELLTDEFTRSQGLLLARAEQRSQ